MVSEVMTAMAPLCVMRCQVWRPAIETATQADEMLYLLGGAELQRHLARRCFGDGIEVVQDARRPVEARVPQELAQRPAKQVPPCLGLQGT